MSARARVTSNLPAVARGNSILGDALNMRRRLRAGRTLGEEAITVMAVGVQLRTMDQQLDANARPLPPLRERTLRRKARLGQPATIGVATGEMLSTSELEGRKTITKQNAIVELGESEEVRDKIDWFVTGDEKRNRPPRDIIGIDRATEKQLDQLADEALGAAIKDAQR